MKFDPAADQKKLEKIINSGEGHFRAGDLKKMRERIEVIADVLKELAQ
jgi:hypothetical protein